MTRKMMCVFVLLGIGGLVSLAGDQATQTRNAAVTTGGRLPAENSPHVEGKFVMHEWGTFTTFSGSNGVFLDFRPLAQEHDDLPPYILDRTNFSGSGRFLKARIRGRVRMETPVTYFYTDRVRSVNVSVDFPKGLLTEFYPPVQAMSPPLNEKLAFGEGEPVGNSSLDWGTIDLIPQSALAIGIQDEAVRKQAAERLMHLAVPHGPNERHYAHARATDSALVHTRRGLPSQSKGSPHQDAFEKFLFYRGVGNFELPVAVTFQNDTPVFVNRGDQPIRSVILIESRSGHIHATRLEQVAAGEAQVFSVADEMNVDQLTELVKHSLVEDGLYEKEAQSMVDTWKDSWFTEDGRRVLYMVPGDVTEELLPLHISPEPQERLRVLVGRMEIMSPKDEQKLTQQVAQSVVARAEFLKKHGPPKKGRPVYQVPDSVKAWGRMAEPALVRISKVSDSQPIQREATQLLSSLRSAG